MAQQTVTNIGGYLKRNYVGPIRDQLNNMSVLYYRSDKNEEDVSGEDLTARMSLFYKRNQGIGARAEGDTMPTPGRRTNVYTTVAMAYEYGSIEISGPAIAASRKAETSLARVVEDEVEGMVEGLRIEVNRQMWGRGTGAMAQVTQATGTIVAGNLATVDDVSRLEEGMVVEMWSTNAGSGGTQQTAATSAEISKIDPVTNSIAFVANQDVTLNYFIYRGEGTALTTSRGKVMMGIEGGVDGTNSQGTRLITTFQGIGRDTNFWWNANVLDANGTNRDLSFDLVQRAYEVGEIIGGGNTSLILSGYDVRRAYVALCLEDKRYVNYFKLDGGWSALEYSGGSAPTPWVVDRMALKNRAFFLDEKSFAIFRASDFDWMDLDGAVLRKKSGVDAYEATCFAYMNLGWYRSNVNTVLRDVQ